MSKKEDLITKVFDLYQKYRNNPKQDLQTYQFTIDTIAVIRDLFNPNTTEYRGMTSIINHLIEMALSNTDI